METGQFFTPSFSGSDPSNTNTVGGLPDRIANGNLPAGQRTLEHWFDASAFVVPRPGHYGNASPYSLVGPGLYVHNHDGVQELQNARAHPHDLHGGSSEPLQSPFVRATIGEYFLRRARSG